MTIMNDWFVCLCCLILGWQISMTGRTTDLTDTWLAKLARWASKTCGIRLDAPGGPKRSGQSEADAGLTAWPVDLDRFIGLDECARALLAHAVLPTERHSVSDGEGFTEEHKKKRHNRRELDNKQIKHACNDSVCFTLYIQVCIWK